MRRLYATFVAALVLGNAVGIFSLASNFALLEKYQINADIVYVYFNLHETSQNTSGLKNSLLLSYVVVVNVTNPTSKTILLRDITINIAKNITLYRDEKSQRVSGYNSFNSLIQCYRYFPQGDTSYMLQPNASTLYLFSGVLSAYPIRILFGGQTPGQDPVGSVLEIQGRTAEGAYVTTGFAPKSIQLSVIGQSEYVYNNILGNPRIHFRDDGPSLSFTINR